MLIIHAHLQAIVTGDQSNCLSWIEYTDGLLCVDLSCSMCNMTVRISLDFKLSHLLRELFRCGVCSVSSCSFQELPYRFHHQLNVIGKQ